MKLRAFETASEIYRRLKNKNIKGEVKDQIMRASLSVCLNLAEGNNRDGRKDRRRFFNIALTSHREVQALIKLEELHELDQVADRLGAELYCLHRSCT